MNFDDLKSSMRRFSFVGLLAILLVLGGIGGWAALARIQGAVMAPGQLVVESTSKRIQHRDGGDAGPLHEARCDHLWLVLATPS